MTRFLLGFIFIALGLSVQAQEKGVIRGKIKLEDGSDAAGVTLKVKGTGLLAISDDKGFYAIPRVPYGQQVLEVSSLETESLSRKVIIDRRHIHVNLTLTPKKETGIEEVSVLRNTEKREIETSGFAATVIETKQASVRNLTTNELLDRAVGVRVRQSGGLGAEVTYNLNGMTGNSVGIFVDGIETSTYGSSFNLNNIPPSMIERIEVYKGVLPAHLSGDLLGGAINVVLKKGASLQNNITASVSYGSFNTLQSDLSASYRNPKTGLTIRGSAFLTNTDNNYRVWGRFVRQEMPNGRMEPIEARRFHDAFNTYGGRFEIGFSDVKWADNFMVGYNGTEAYNEIQHGQFMTRPYMGRFTKSHAHVLSLNYNKKDFLLKDLHLLVNGVYSDRDQNITDTVTYNYTWLGERLMGLRYNENGEQELAYIRSPYGAQQGAPTMATIERKVVNIRSNLNYDVTANHRLYFNHVFYTVDRNDSDPLRVIVGEDYRATNDLSRNVFSLGHEMRAFDQRLKTNLFAKFYEQTIDRIHPYQGSIDGTPTRLVDTIRNTRMTTGFGLALSYTVTPKVILISSAERAVRMPNEGEIFGSPDENVVANPLLRPESSDNLNLGARLGAFDLDRHTISFGASGFVRNTKDQIMQRTDNQLNEATQTSPFVNLGRTQAVGFEAEMTYIYHRDLTVNFNLSRFNSLFKMPETVHYNRQVPNLPFFTMNSNVWYHFEHLLQRNSRLDLFYNAGYVSSFNVTWQESTYSRTPTQFIHDLGLSYTFPNRKILLSLDAKNFTNQAAFDNFGAQKPGRAFYLKVNYSINNF